MFAEIVLTNSQLFCILLYVNNNILKLIKNYDRRTETIDIGTNFRHENGT